MIYSLIGSYEALWGLIALRRRIGLIHRLYKGSERSSWALDGLERVGHIMYHEAFWSLARYDRPPQSFRLKDSFDGTLPQRQTLEHVIVVPKFLQHANGC